VHAIDELPVDRFHFINAEQVFEHLVAPAQVMQWLAGSLVHGGLLRISVPNGAGVESLVAQADWAASKGSPRSLNAIAPLEHINCHTWFVDCARRPGVPSACSSTRYARPCTRWNERGPSLPRSSMSYGRAREP
jgi:hypothetical protein